MLRDLTRNIGRAVSLRLFVVFFALIVLLIVFKSGVWPMPNLFRQFQISQSLYSIPFENPAAHYLYQSYLQPFIFGILSGHTLLGYVAYTSFITLLFVFLWYLSLFSYHAPKVVVGDGRYLLIVFFPVSAIPFYWIGMDGMTLLLMLVTLWAIRSYWFFIPAFLLGIQHFEQGFIGFGVLYGTIVLYFLGSRLFDALRINFIDSSFKFYFLRLTVILSFIFLGKLALVFWFNVNGIVLEQDRLVWIENHLPAFFSNWKSYWYLILWSLLGGAWIILLVYIRCLWPLFFGVLAAFILTIFVGDQSRVGLIVLFPTIYFWVFMNVAFFQLFGKKFIMFMLAVYLVVPFVIIFGGVQGSLFPWGVDLFREFLSSNFDYMAFDWYLPFK